MKRFLPALLMSLNAVLAFALMWSGGPLDDLFIAGVLYAAVLGLLALLLAIRPHGFVALLGRGAAIAIATIVIAFGILGQWFPMFWGGIPGGSMSPRELAIGLLLVFVQWLLYRALLFVDSRPSGGRTGILFVAAAGWVVFLALFYVSQIGENALRFVLLIPRVRADSIMRTAVPRTQACAVEYANRNGGYPESLAAMGPSPEGTGCLDAEHASGRIGLISLAYVPGSRDGGAIRTYQVVARGNIGFERGEPWMAFGDESGIVRSGDSTTQLTDLRIYHGGMLAVRSLRACARLHRERDTTQAYPRNWRGLFSMYRFGEERMMDLGCDARLHPSFSSGRQDQARYTALGDSLSPTDYVIEIRPRVYGLTGVRSLLFRATGPVFSTVEDRGATERDPTVPTCAPGRDDGNCMLPDSTVPPRVNHETR